MVGIIHRDNDSEHKTAQEAGLIKKTQVKHIVDEEVITSAQISRMANDKASGFYASKGETQRMIAEQMDRLESRGDKEARAVYDKIYSGVKKYS